MASNTNQNITVGLQTRPFESHEDSATSAQFAVEYWVQQPEGSDSKYIAFTRDNAHFDSFLADTMEARAGREGFCIDWDTVSGPHRNMSCDILIFLGL